MNPRSALRTATADDHERVDRFFSRFRLSEASGYRAFLQATAAAYLPAEQALEEAGAPAVLPDWPERRRAHLLGRDLAGMDAAPAPGVPISIHGEGAVLGAVYVLEGSRLGGALLRRSIPQDLPQSFLAAPAAPGAWRKFTEFLDRNLADRQKLAEAILAARQVFASFAVAGRAELEPVQ